MKNMGKVITAIIKRTLFYLVLGFITAWLVAWGLAMVPRVMQAISVGLFDTQIHSKALGIGYIQRITTLPMNRHQNS